MNRDPVPFGPLLLLLLALSACKQEPTEPSGTTATSPTESRLAVLENVNINGANVAIVRDQQTNQEYMIATSNYHVAITAMPKEATR